MTRWNNFVLVSIGSTGWECPWIDYVWYPYVCVDQVNQFTELNGLDLMNEFSHWQVE